jgi:hypothetical protein
LYEEDIIGLSLNDKPEEPLKSDIKDKIDSKEKTDIKEEAKEVKFNRPQSKSGKRPDDKRLEKKPIDKPNDEPKKKNKLDSLF